MIRTVVGDELPLETLWPVNSGAQLYVGFPVTTQGDEGWTQQFNGYIENLFEKGKIPES